MIQEYAIAILVHVTFRNVQIVYTFMQIMEFDVGPLCHAFVWDKIFFSQEMNDDDDEDSDHEFRLITFTCDDPNCAFCCHTCNDLECPYCTHRCFDPDPECPLCNLD